MESQSGPRMPYGDGIRPLVMPRRLLTERKTAREGCGQCGNQLVVYAQHELMDILEIFPGKRIFSGRWDIQAGWDVYDTGRVAICKGSPAGEEVISIIDGQQVQLFSHSSIPTALRYSTFAIEAEAPDGLPLDGMLYIPNDSHKPYPAAVISHGGPYWRVTEGNRPKFVLVDALAALTRLRRSTPKLPRWCQPWRPLRRGSPRRPVRILPGRHRLHRALHQPARNRPISRRECRLELRRLPILHRSDTRRNFPFRSRDCRRRPELLGYHGRHKRRAYLPRRADRCALLEDADVCRHCWSE